MIEKYKEEFCKNYNIYEKEYVDEETNKQLNERIKEFGLDSDYNGEGLSFQGYLYDKVNDEAYYKFYVLKPVKLKDDDINKAIMFENNNHLRRIDKNVNFITVVLKVCIVLTIIAAVLSIIIIVANDPY